MAGWTEEIDWSNASGVANAPADIVLGEEGLLGAANERNSTIIDTSAGILDINSPIENIRDSLVYAVEGATIKVGEAIIARRGYIQETDEGGYDYSDKPQINYWDMDKMEEELGSEPEFYGTNAPINAEWVKWWYDALNLLTHVSYPFGGLLSLGSYQQSDRTAISLSSFGEAKTTWEDDTEWDDWEGLSSSPRHLADRTYPFDDFIIQRVRTRMNPTDRFSPVIYTGKNYKLLSVFGRFSSSGGLYFYQNADYPSATEGTFGVLYSDDSDQQGVYSKDVTLGDFSTVTVTEPPDGPATTTKGWSTQDLRILCQFDIEGGFEYVAPSP